MNSRITSWMVFPWRTHTAVNRRLRSSAITGAHVAPSTGQAAPTLWVPGHASLMLIALRSSANLRLLELADWPEPRSLPSLCLPAKSVHHGKRGWYKTLLFRKPSRGATYACRCLAGFFLFSVSLSWFFCILSGPFSSTRHNVILSFLSS